MESTASQDGVGGGSHELDYSDLLPNLRTDTIALIGKHGVKMKELLTVVKATLSKLQKIEKWANTASYHGFKRLQAILDMPHTFTDIRQVPKPVDFLVFIDRIHEVDELVLRRKLNHECMYAYLEPTSEFKHSTKTAIGILHNAILDIKYQDTKIDKLEDLSDAAIRALHGKICLGFLSMRKGVCESEGVIGTFLKACHALVDSLRKDRDAVDAEERKTWETLSDNDRTTKLYGMMHQMLDGGEENRMVNLEQGEYTARWKNFRTLGMYDAVSGLLHQWEEMEKVWTTLMSVNIRP